MAPNGLDMLKVKNTNTHAAKTSEAQILFVLLCDGPFLSYAPFPEKYSERP